ncbi:MAG: NAD(P)H-binding protein [Altibacter sp.]|uniref:NAD(P)H-binding protein n=1 Tax=Altibacter sp. TaxID=2024823 RepID=UPI001D3A7957|nr:NAD(P)H-binding protein [Altibacter sp.]MBZ0326526.1 NAD(P)H-binding protein [Altibacter sp.]
MSKTAIILGATGLTGSILLEYLLEDSFFNKVKVFSRNSVGKTHPKLEEHLLDLFELQTVSDQFIGDVVFCCIGTTKAKTPNKETYRKIDYGIPVSGAKLAKQNGMNTFIVISALGANPKSRVFYNRVKGEMERDVLRQEIKHSYVLQPSLIGGNRNEKRMGERMAQVFMNFFGFLVPKKYKMIHPEAIAKAMQILARKGFSATRITSEKIIEIAAQ